MLYAISPDMRRDTPVPKLRIRDGHCVLGTGDWRPSHQEERTLSCIPNQRPYFFFLSHETACDGAHNYSQLLHLSEDSGMRCHAVRKLARQRQGKKRTRNNLYTHAKLARRFLDKPIYSANN
jgi:hypothetical protein